MVGSCLLNERRKERERGYNASLVDSEVKNSSPRKSQHSNMNQEKDNRI